MTVAKTANSLRRGSKMRNTWIWLAAALVLMNVGQARALKEELETLGWRCRVVPH